MSAPGFLVWVLVGTFAAGVLVITILCCTASCRSSTGQDDLGAKNLAVVPNTNSQHFQTRSSPNRHGGSAPLLPLHAHQTWGAPAPAYSPPSSAPLPGFPSDEQRLPSPALVSPNLPTPVYCTHDDPASILPTTRTSAAPFSPTLPSASEHETKSAMSSIVNEPDSTSLIDRMREVHRLMEQVHGLRNEGSGGGGSNSDERIRELEQRVTQLTGSRIDGNSIVSAEDGVDPPPYYVPTLG
ncbi:hypothetical protein CPC08DRAFT_708956 [Agrocybe pediades]|nr:hypothetical protein CPC08DRAFT_708956 [Agrocybe pediades]